MPHALTAIALFLMLLAPGLVDAADETAAFNPANGYSLDEAGLKKVALELRKDRATFLRMRPRYPDCRDIAPKESDAIRLVNASDQEIRWIAENIELPKTGELSIWSWTVGQQESAGALEALSRKAERFRKGTTFWWVGFGKDAKGRSTMLHSFVAQGGRWIFFPFLHLTIDDKSYPTDAMTLFLSLVKTGDYDSAYEQLSSHLQDQITREKFPKAIRALGIHNMDRMKTGSRGFKRYWGGHFMRRTYDTESEGGQQLAVTIYAADDGKQTRILHIDARSAFGLEGNSIFLPPALACRELARRSILLFADAFATGELEPALAACTDTVRKQLTPEHFHKAFAEHIKSAKDFAFVADADIRWATFPAINGQPNHYSYPKNMLRSQPKGMLVLNGAALSKDGTRKVLFAFHLTHQGSGDAGRWLLSGVVIRVPEPVNAPK